MRSVLVLGATGYIGGRLVPRLVLAGHRVRALAREPAKLTGREWSDVEIAKGDLLDPVSLKSVLAGIDVVYYLVHSMNSTGGDFAERDRIAATNLANAVRSSGVRRIVYLGGLGKKEEAHSPHLRSRHEVGDILRSSGIPVTEFRAAVVVGSGSSSFEMIHHLVNRLPMMICPRWLVVKTQPIAVSDVLRYLIDCLDIPETAGRVIDIGGPDVLTYREMMLTVARALGLRRLLIQVPVLTPRLSSYWVNLVTPIPAHLARSLIESVRHETICENDDARRMFAFAPLSFEDAVRTALRHIAERDVETRWTEASMTADASSVDPSHLRVDRRVLDVRADAASVFSVISSIGGENGWYYGDWLWKLRGFIDQQAGGVGLRRGRRHPTDLRAGEVLDFWRVEEILPDRTLRLRAEMIVWGSAWLEFSVEPLGPGLSRLTQTASYYPRGLTGFLYWYGILPIHSIVFRGLARAIASRALKSTG